MNIWLIMSGEPLEQFGERPHRVGILSKMLVSKGHSVTWWTTDYDHQHKKYFYKQDREICNNFGVNMIFLHPKTKYNKNISLQRIINYKQVASKFKMISKNKSKPDIILCAFPSIDLAYEAVKYGKNNDIPVVIDVRDMWPDIFLEIVPKYLQGLMRLFLTPLYNDTKYIFKNTYAITAMTNQFIEYGLKYGDRQKTELEQSFPFGYPKFNLTKENENLALNKLKNFNINFEKFIICYFGTIGKQFDFIPVIDAAKTLKDEDIQFVLCGTGDNLEQLKRDTEKLDNIIIPGWINQAEIWTLMKYSKVSLAPYKNSKDFLMSIPNKAIEYMGGSLPVLSSIDGVLGAILKENQCGFVYKNSNDKLVDSILLLKRDSKLHHKMSENALNLFKNRFSADIVYENMSEYLEEITKIYKEKNND